MKITQELIAAIIAYPMDDAGFTPAERQRMAEVFAAQLHIKNVDKFLEACKRASEQEAA